MLICILIFYFAIKLTFSNILILELNYLILEQIDLKLIFYIDYSSKIFF